MDWRDTPQQAAFREEVRRFVRDRFPADYGPNLADEPSMEPEDVHGYEWAADRKSADPTRRAGAAAWAAALAERGWVAPHWPAEYGGAGLTVMELFALQEEMMRARVPTVSGIGAYLLGPTLLEYGTEEQRRVHLPPISAGRVAWAQGFSEPDAGSDLAGLRTRAVRDGNDYVVNGQKVWTSQAQHADWLFALVRTDPEAPRHRGITYLLVDLATPGVTVRPIQDMRGAYPFAEIFFEDARVPVANRVGEENGGWRVAMATLGYERSGIGSTIRFEQALARLVALIREGKGRDRLRADWRTAVRHEIAQRHIEIRVLHNLVRHAVSLQAAGEPPGTEASVNQLFGAELHQRLARTGALAFGPHGALWRHEGAPLEAEFMHDWVGSVAHPFLGGSAEVQRNIIATRGLGLPRG